MSNSLSSEMHALWSPICEHLRCELGAVIYEQWIEQLLPLSFENNILLLQGADDFFCSWLMDSYGVSINGAIAKFLGTDVKIKFTFSDKEQHVLNQIPVDVVPIKASVAKKQEPVKESSSTEPIVAEGCDPSYTFDNFVMGDENKIAYFSALEAAKSPGIYNPLFIYGSTSLGKTHLLQSVANAYLRSHPKKVVKYVSCETIMNDYTSMIPGGNRKMFEEKYRKVDILLVDDVHFLGRTEQLQEEFFNTFNTLFQRHKQIVLASDKPPSEINGLEQRLVARFESGLIAEVLPPTYEMRLAVLRKFREMYFSRVGDDVLELLARKVTVSVMRRLKGAMVQIRMFEKIQGVPPDLTNVKKMMSSVLDSEAPAKMLSIDVIQKKVASYYNVKMTDLLGAKRSRNISMPRQVAMFLARKMTQHSYPEIANAFEGKNHATILHAFRKIELDIQVDESLKESIKVIEQSLKE